MKHRILKLTLLAAILGVSVQGLDAQVKKRPAKKRTPAAAKPAADVAPAEAAVAPAQDAVKPADTLVLNLNDGVRKSLRNDNAIELNLVKDRVPLPYEHIREDDAVYRQRVWRELDVHEKMNLPFVYKADGDNGNQRFITILLSAIKAGEANGGVTAFSPIDDRFTTPITMKGIMESLVGKPKTISIPDYAKDPDGSKGYMKDTIVIDEFNPDNVEKYWIKEDWVFDKESSRMQVRILGIAPLKTIRNEDGSFRDVTPLFWVYYPDLRPTLARFDAYNGRNFGARQSWEELFESRMFASRVIKSTIDNPSDMYIKEYIKDPILALLEGDNVKEKIFNYEQDLWSY